MVYLIDVIHTSTSNPLILPYSDQYIKNNLLIRTYKKYSFIDTYLIIQQIANNNLQYTVKIKNEYNTS